jgi:(p)ppGpp synthase/HD superfamily hydrolase
MEKKGQSPYFKKGISLGECYEHGDILMQRAEELVKQRITGSRKGVEGEPNYLHSFRLRDMVKKYHHWDDPDHELFIAALLHDIVEDGAVSFEELWEMEFTERIIELVRLCTHPMDVEDHTERWLLMVAKLIEANNEDAWRIKLADLADNIAQSKGLTPENRRFMIEVKTSIYLRVGHVSHSAWPQLEEEAKKQRKDMEGLDRRPVQCHLWNKEDLTSDDLNTAFDELHTFSQDSHFSRKLVRCKDCGQLYLKEFFEEIDWVDGEDPQYITYVPVMSMEDAEEVNKARVWELQKFSPRLNSDYPKDKPKLIHWVGKYI